MGVAGDSADQVVKVTLDGVDIMLRLAGDGAKDIAKLIIHESRKPQRTKGRASLLELFKQQTPVKVFSIEDKNLKMFCKEAKRYGVLYHVLKNKKDTGKYCDILVRSEDVEKVNRILTRYNIGRNNQAVIREVINKHKDDKSKTSVKPKIEKSPEDKFIDELFRKENDIEKTDPFVTVTEKGSPSESLLPFRKEGAGQTKEKSLSERDKRKSVNELIKEIKKDKEKVEKPADKKIGKNKNLSKKRRKVNGKLR